MLKYLSKLKFICSISRIIFKAGVLWRGFTLVKLPAFHASEKNKGRTKSSCSEAWTEEVCSGGLVQWYAKLVRECSNFAVTTVLRYGLKLYEIDAFILGNLFPTSSGVDEQASKRISAMERASKASCAEQANECAARANKQTDERVAQHLRPDSWLF